MRHRHDICLNAMKSSGETMTADKYSFRNYGLSYEDLCAGEYPEWLAEVDELIADGELFVEISGGGFMLAIPEEE